MGQRRSPLDVVELEHLAARGWRGTETEALGGWLLRAGGGGFTRRAHSALATGDPGLPLTDAVAVVTDWYARRALPAVVALPGRQARPADAALAAAGWGPPEAETVVLTVPLEDEEPGPGVPVSSAPRPDDAWLAAARRAGEPLPADAEAVLTHADRLAFASVRDDEGTVVGVARGVLVEDWLGIATVGVDPAARRGGLATALTRALQSWAVDEGARWCHLQVLADNAPARALYRRLGFIEHHRYHYRQAPAPVAGPVG
ncbi:N-acetyltransferase [Modestobacter sp. Leaf380]|uniref:GNAT family N-acetyltransferase n=1 Tax=Modestobacter sp. Leaf380 TaxID=1736356 RepID=UPI0006F6B92F|nr:GNAT family N-acetyltransferase [Modestobacter sp. Leaf380]KQS68321.1 GCN5 family acetyltransferase [Modestobacter sp. Leaf380]